MHPNCFARRSFADCRELCKCDRVESVTRCEHNHWRAGGAAPPECRAEGSAAALITAAAGHRDEARRLSQQYKKCDLILLAELKWTQRSRATRANEMRRLGSPVCQPGEFLALCRKKNKTDEALSPQFSTFLSVLELFEVKKTRLRAVTQRC